MTGNIERNRQGFKNAREIAERLTEMAYSRDTKKSFDDAIDSWNQVFECAEVLTAVWSDKKAGWEYGEIPEELKNEIYGNIDQLELRRGYAWP